MRNLPMAIFLSSAFIFQTTVFAEGLCPNDELEVFNCQHTQKFASLCKKKETGIFTYRHGTKDNIDLIISDEDNHKGSVFYFSNTTYAGGGEAHIRFSKGKFTYFLYDKTIKTDDGPEFSAGIAVYRGASKISNSLCLNDASIHQDAYIDITKETYKDIKAE